MTESVDAVLLAGGLPDPETGGFRPLSVIYQECRRLADVRIPVVAAHRLDVPYRDYDFMRRPKNLAIVSSSQSGLSKPTCCSVATIGDPSRRNRIDIGTSTMKSDARFRITLERPRKKKRDRFDYVANDIASDCGETVTLVTLDRDGSVSVEPRSCDVVKRQQVVIEVTDGTTTQAFEDLVARHIDRLRADRSVELHIIDFLIRGHGTCFEQLRARRPRQDWLKTRRDGIARSASKPHDTAIWVAGVEALQDDTQRERERNAAGPVGRFVRVVEESFPTHRDRVVSQTIPLLMSRS